MVSASLGYHSWEVRVYYEDTDAGGVVYHSNYLKFAERARTEFLRTHGISQHDLNSLYACVLVVSQLNIKYEQPARLDDTIQIRTGVEKWSNASFYLDQSLWKAEEKIAHLKVTVVAVDSKTWRIKRLPPEVTKKLKEGLHG